MEFQSLLLGALLAAVATSLGAAIVVLLKVNCRDKNAKFIGFSAGIMAFASLEMFNQSKGLSDQNTAIIGLIIGILLIALAEKTIPHMHRWVKKKDMEKSKKKAVMIAGTITIHNIPEGFAIASAFSGSPALGWLIASSIAIQDVPEGFMVAGPLNCYGMSPKKALGFGIFSGVVEFASAVIGFLFLSVAASLSPIALAFSAGAMTYVVLVEMLPDAVSNGNERVATIAFLLGIAIAYGLSLVLGA